ncbi:MAG TPA: hypothetical protein PKA63_06935 [Oligoflexia bacterium]|nr:hypothetical protein [Oligoflexia bacterium]HMP48385.1 hypothetical protein [Oligoflexia bacterium]
MIIKVKNKRKLGLSDILLFAQVSIFHSFIFSGEASAQQGSEIFKNAACNLLGPVLTEHFGAMITVLAGAFAIISSVVGSFRMAWVLVFVSVGTFIFPELVEVFFPTECGA